MKIFVSDQEIENLINKATSDLSDELVKCQRDRDDFKESFKSAEVKNKELLEQIKNLEADHAIELKKKQHELDIFESIELQKLRKEHSEMKEQLAVAKKEAVMFKQAADTTAEIINVKETMTKLIEKLPNIDIKSIMAGGSKDV